MLRKIGLATAAAAFTLSSAPLGAESRSFLIRARVPVVCQVQFRPIGATPIDGTTIPLGEISEFCNAPGGYELVVNYAPGTMQGAVIVAGEDQVVLNGSGQAILTRSPRPRNRARLLSAMPGQQGFDTDRLDLRVQPMGSLS
ncbi:hypothetical protein [Sphingosinicella sp. CPCC 101087]|uniref:hypothetical protein n=1 Tax=Sphingosinicella sp. CPCC 101087 TaxID=2497754 RepID=UPI001FB1097F|nr:hypothetical protein [Sphingosinicella sp. CPCC 101087]